ncbi:MAG: PEP-CTERM sorting domain-containing protein, partial [Pseudomonadota bacterium]
HGSRSGGMNMEGWLYIEKAISGLISTQTRPGTLTVDVAALGSAANPTFTSGNAGGAIGSAADVLGKTVAYYDGDTAINQFFTDLAAGTVNPGVLWLAGTGAANDLDALEGAALTANAAAINSFVSSGGGLMSHGSGTTAYGWLSALLPGIVEVLSCQSSGATLTAAGAAAFPGLSNSDIDANAGPCHSHFTGDFGGLVALALDGQQRSYIIGGGPNTVIQCGQPGQPACPQQVPEPPVLPLLGIALAAVFATTRRWNRC